MRILVLGFSVALAGCATTPAMSERGAGTCSDEDVATFIGADATTELGAEVLRVTTAERLRWINRDTLVTADYRTDRVNIELDDEGRVTQIRCG